MLRNGAAHRGIASGAGLGGANLRRKASTRDPGADEMSDVDRELCRKAAAECLELARVTTNPDIRQTLLVRAQEWLKLAYAESDERFEQLLSGFNSGQLAGSGPVRRQPVQQQQSKQKPK
jgi:hypothetical protein